MDGATYSRSLLCAALLIHRYKRIVNALPQVFRTNCSFAMNDLIRAGFININRMCQLSAMTAQGFVRLVDKGRLRLYICSMRKCQRGYIRDIMVVRLWGNQIPNNCCWQPTQPNHFFRLNLSYYVVLYAQTRQVSRHLYSMDVLSIYSSSRPERPQRVLRIRGIIVYPIKQYVHSDDNISRRL